jgi:Zn-dependent protease with chaperone function
MRIAAIVALLLCAACVFAAETAGQFDARIERELSILDAGAVALWKQANAARAQEKHREAAGLYAQVYARVPAFVHALRRQGYEELLLGDRPLALQHLRAAVAQVRSAENLAALAAALVQTGDAAPPDGEAREARELAKEAVALEPRDTANLMILARVGEATGDLSLVRRAAYRMSAAAPNDFQTHLLWTRIAMHDGDLARARTTLERARDAGMPPELYASIDASLNEASLKDARPFYARWWKVAAILLIAWIAGFGVLLAAGAILSRAAVRAAREPLTDLSGNATSLSAGIRRVYVAVLFLCSIFYYASIPVAILLVLGAAGGILYGFYAAGSVPVKLVVLVVVVAGVSIWSMLKSLFIRRSDDDPGLRVDLVKEARLRNVLDEVAAKIGTRAVDNVYLTPGTEVAVMERPKARERCLILGVAALDGLAMRPFKAVLGHEYGHFVNRDTAGGTFALSVRSSINAIAIGIAQGGAAAWYNPAWLFVSAFNRVFLRISEGASRLQEVLADRWAVFAYGAQAFEDGLRHVIERGVRFDAHAGATLKEVVDGHVPLANLYTYVPAQPDADLSEAVRDALQRKSSPYDSHPAPAERFALVHALPQRSMDASPADNEPAWTLFADPVAVQRAMTAQVRANVLANYGVEIAGPRD